MSENVKIRYYLVAFIDIVGQRAKLNELKKFPTNNEEINDVVDILIETSEYVKQLRNQFSDYFNRKPEPTGLLNNLPPSQREWLEKRNKPNYWYRGISDSFIITVPCFDEVLLFGKHVGDIYSCLYGLCMLFLWSLAMEKPFRGGVEVHLGTEIAEQEVYGPVTVKAYELENCHYPCVFVGDGLLNHLDKVEASCPGNLDGKHTLINIKNCRDLITKDNAGTYILDFMGEGVKSVPTSITLQLVKDAYYFVVGQEKHFSVSGNKHLLDYYTQLRTYFESKLSLWGIDSLQ